jgi:hypothetical protein
VSLDLRPEIFAICSRNINNSSEIFVLSS